MHHRRPKHSNGLSTRLVNKLNYHHDCIQVKYVLSLILLLLFDHIQKQFFFILQTGISRLNYTPTSDLDYGTLSCWGRNAIGFQKSPCVFQVVAAGNFFFVTLIITIVIIIVNRLRLKQHENILCPLTYHRYHLHSFACRFRSTIVVIIVSWIQLFFSSTVL